MQAQLSDSKDIANPSYRRSQKTKNIASLLMADMVAYKLILIYS
jgi:hypothetical protein